MKKILNQRAGYFWYFVIIAPILAKVIEWIYQIIPSGFYYVRNFWYYQIISILFYAFLVFMVRGGLSRRLQVYELASIVGIAYFIKEVYNAIFVYHALNFATLIDLTLEPIFMFTILGLFLPKLFFKKLK